MLRTLRDSISIFSALFVTALFVAVISLPAAAESSPYDVQVHFSREVAVPGHVLRPGTYILHRVSVSTPDSYEIIAARGSQIIGFFHVLPVSRTNDGTADVYMSAPHAAGVRLLDAWYAPGETQGYAFQYSRNDARNLGELAQAHLSNDAVGQ